jgi:S1-C subfamily serine protease
MQESQGSGNESPEREGAWPSFPGAGDPRGGGTDPQRAPDANAGQPAPPQPQDQPAAQTQPAEPAPQARPWQHQPWQQAQPGTQPATPNPPEPQQQPRHGYPGQWGHPAPAGEQPTWGYPAGGQGTEEPQGTPASRPEPAGQPAAGWVPLAGAPQGPWATPPGGQGNWPPPPGDFVQPAGPGRSGPGGRAGRVLIYVLVAVLAAALGAGAVLAVQHKPGSSALATGTIPSAQNPPGNINTSTINVRYVAGKVEPGVVDITSYLRYTGQVFEGTGMVLNSSGLVLTNNHVVNGSTRLVVTLANDSSRKFRAQIVGTDAKDDVALLKLVGAAGLKTVTVGNSDKVTLGTPVVAIGNAGGTGGSPTVTSGTITALNRTITASDSGAQTSETLHNMLQTNAPIAEGDSGGPLSNAAGQVIGMDTAANTQSLGAAGTDQGFAIPINRALGIARQMAAGHGSGSIRIGQPAFIGIAIASTAKTGASTATSPRQQLQQLEQVASGFGGAINSSGGCLVQNVGNPVPARIAPASSGTLVAGVFCNAPARSAGIHGGDVIVAINGQPVGSPSALTQLMTRYHPGNSVSVTWVDTSGSRHTKSLTLAAGPAK